MAATPKRKRVAPVATKPLAASKARRLNIANKTVEASVTVELEGTPSSSEAEDSDGSDDSEELLPVLISSRSAKKPAATAPTKRAPSPARPAYNRGKSPSGRAVLNVRDIDSSSRENSVEDGYTVVAKKKKEKKAALESLPKEHTHSRKIHAEGADTDEWTRDVDSYSLCSSVNMYTTTAIDDEQVIAYALRRRGLFPQWRKVCTGLLWATTPLFGAAALGCHLLGGAGRAQEGVAMLLVYLAVQLLAVLAGMPLVLLQRILSSLSTGRNSELEVLCLFLSVVVMVCVSITYNAIRGGRCGVLWCEGDSAV